MRPAPRNILIVTTTRADWGILSPLATALSARSDVKLTIAAGNMHIMSRYGNTINEIRREGFENVVALEVPDNIDETSASRTAIAASTANSLAKVIEETKPDAVIILGDRYEMLGAATAALIAGIPIVHLHGGEVSQGAIDDSVRHALSKMATLHLVATEKAVTRLISMGEEPERIVRTGALGVQNAMSIEPIPLEELRESLDNFDIDRQRTLIVTFHPVTRHPDNLSTSEQVDNLLGALDDVPQCNAIITFPNNDTGSEVIIEKLKSYAQKNPNRIKMVESLGKTRYLSALRYVRAVVGNSSSGLLEAPSTPADTIDIGPRQQGRECAASVIHVPDDRRAIGKAISNLLLTPVRKVDYENNPYYRANSAERAARAILEKLPTLSLTKIFKE